MSVPVILGSPRESFLRFSDSNGNRLISLNKDGSLFASCVDLGPYSAASQGSMGQINGITFLGDFPPAAPYGSAFIDIGIYVTSTPNGSAMGVNSAIAIQGNTHNCMALNGQIASPSAYTGDIAAGMYCVYGETDHNGSGVMNLGIGVQGQVYQQGAGHIKRSTAGYFESCSGFYKTSTGGIDQPFGLIVKSGGLSGTLGANDTTVLIDSPYTGATFTNRHIGLRIADQSAGGILPSPYAIKVEGSSSYVDLGGNVLSWNGTDTGISRLSSGVLAIGTGNQGQCNGTLNLTVLSIMASPSAPTSTGTAGTIGQIIANGGNLYFCSATGTVGNATWNKLSMTAV